MRCLRRLEYRSLCSNGNVCNYLAFLYAFSIPVFDRTLSPLDSGSVGPSRNLRLTGTRTLTPQSSCATTAHTFANPPQHTRGGSITVG